MKPANSALFFLIVVLFFGSPVISDRLVVETDSSYSDIDLPYVHDTDPGSAASLKKDLISTTLLLCIGFVGLAVINRKRLGEKDYDEDIAP